MDLRVNVDGITRSISNQLPPVTLSTSVSSFSMLPDDPKRIASAAMKSLNIFILPPAPSSLTQQQKLTQPYNS